MPDKTNQQLRIVQLIGGCKVKKITPLVEVRGNAIELVHPQSGARLVHIQTEDTENLFSISFPTPPSDNSGAPHVLEHSVLAGSRKYPLKELFFEMIKTSMATFINAMTGPDCTCYPVASNVRQDLFNLGRGNGFVSQAGGDRAGYRSPETSIIDYPGTGSGAVGEMRLTC